MGGGGEVRAAFRPFGKRALEAPPGVNAFLFADRPACRLNVMTHCVKLHKQALVLEACVDSTSITAPECNLSFSTFVASTWHAVDLGSIYLPQVQPTTSTSLTPS